MKARDIVKPEYTSKMVGAIFAVMFIYLLFSGYTNAAFASFFLAVFIPIILHRATVEKDTADSMLKTNVQPLINLIEDLEIEGKGIVIPEGKNLSESKVYVPAGEIDSLPELYDEMTLVTGLSDEMGVSLQAPGKPLVDEAMKRVDYEPSGEGIESSRECMGVLTNGLNLANSYSFREEDEGYKLRITLGGYDDFCEGLRKKKERICTSVGCPICSSYMVCAVKGLEKPLRIEDFEKDDKHIKFTLGEV